MAALRYAAIRGMFELLWASRLTALLRATSRARGIIFTLHRVLPDDPADFSPNAILQVKPDFLEYAIRKIRALGFEIVDIGEAVRRIESEFPEKRFAVFTFDDAYRDNLKYALPILRREQCPFTLYIPTTLVDGVGEVWWQALEDIIAQQRGLAVEENGETQILTIPSAPQKQAAYEMLYAKMRAMPETDRDLAAHCRSLIMDWTELRTFAADQLCTIGAHTVHHYELAKLSAEQATSEIGQSLKVLEAQFGKRPLHLSYPIGGKSSAGPREYQIARDLGLRSAVTTIPGGLYRHHRNSLMALPRVSLNGSFQAKRYVDVYGSPDVFTLLGR
jgi:peptidoglycan/xylan/chitin deacetylase (PgdA/CDA1 family)